MSAVIAGIGCRKGCPAEEILELVETALAKRPSASLQALATADSKAGEPGLLEAAERLGVPLRTIPRESLEALQAEVATVSVRVEAYIGLGALAEAAALAAAGPEAEILLPRTASAQATCALAGRLR